MTPSEQVKLLRVLDTSTFRHVGGIKEIRLSTITLEVPALRQRRADVVLLAEYFTAQFNARCGFSKRTGPDAMARLARHAWPGNVRELLHEQ